MTKQQYSSRQTTVESTREFMTDRQRLLNQMSKVIIGQTVSCCQLYTDRQSFQIWHWIHNDVYTNM